MLVFILCNFLLSAEAGYGTASSKQFLPAPPGERPTCAKEGETYCEEVYYYPAELIRYLLDNYEYDFDSLINSESRDLSPTSIAPARPKLNIATPEPMGGGSVFIPGNQLRNLNETSVRVSTLPPLSPSSIRQSPSSPLPIRQALGNQTAPYPTTLSPRGRVRSDEHVAHDKQRHHPGFIPRSEPYSYTSGNQVKPWWHTQLNSPPFPHRSSRQAANDENTLCPTTSQFATPRAAVNTKGNWMFVVNVNGGNNELTQLVKTEKCATTQCSGLCTVPLGFTATCQQQFVQKRLVALNANGDNLYHDVFWFPHCCICQVRQANG